MSSPSDIIPDTDDLATKKRGREQSAEPERKPTKLEDKPASEVSAPKKTKHEGDPASVGTIRRNLKDMTTQDKSNDASVSSMESTPYHSDGESEEDAQMDAAHQKAHEMNEHEVQDSVDQVIDSSPQTSDINDDKLRRNPLEPSQEVSQTSNHEKSDAEPAKRSPFAAFGGAAGSKGGEDDWGDFAEDEDEEREEKTATAVRNDKEKQKYTFGATSGFGTKAWGATAATPTSNPSKPVFGGFKSSGSPFGAFSGSSPTSSKLSTFGAFAKPSSTAAASPFALAAASSNAPNALSSPTKSSAASTPKEDSPALSNDDASTTCEKEESDEAVIKPKKLAAPAEVFTGEEEETTVYQVKANLYRMENKLWKENGRGNVRINIHNKTKVPRVLMRTEAVYRLILNERLTQGMGFHILQERFVQFHTGSGVCALRVANPQLAEELRENLISNVPPTDSKE
ncbi:hypothetical protein BCR43DRAFT_483030 [Syncephalastrum racemosum]|uniref:RanBD1 domain-containing protein n=1 Tax=Syncephalastrum racemosum TaxID=13706 RepID=A0A1X2HUJ3_SYNRA|nr:hypothetical protein BCR43DRAFT_483030 [Syncephalastrum racemosum]